MSSRPQVVRIYGVEGGRCVQAVSLSFPGGSAGLSVRPLTLLSSGHLIVSCRDYLAALGPSPSPRSASIVPSADSFAGRGELLSDAESDEGVGDEDEGDLKNEREEKRLESDHSLLSGDESRERARIRRLVRQGAAFCCLKLYAAKPPRLPADLPLPPRLAALGLTPAEPAALLAHLPAAAATPTPTPRSAPGSARTPPSSRRVPPVTRTQSRPPSSRRLRRPKSPRPPSRLTPTPGTPGSGRHLSPGWRPQAKPRVR